MNMKHKLFLLVLLLNQLACTDIVPPPLYGPALSLPNTGRDKKTGQIWNRVSPYRTAGGTFSSCTFNGCTTTSDGGALYVSALPSLIVDHCIFSACNSSSGGAIDCQRTQTVILRNSCKFTECCASQQGGAIYSFRIGTCFFIHSSEINRCSANNSKIGKGGMYLYDSPSQGVSSTCTGDDVKGTFWNVVLHDLAVSSCISGDQAGGICLVSPREGYSIHNCRITGCTAASDGGGVYITQTFHLSLTPIIFDYVYFERNTANSHKGHDVYVDDGITYTLTSGPFEKTTCTSNTPLLHRINYASWKGNAADENWLKKGDRILERKIYIHCDSLKTANCGEEKEKDKACNSISSAVLQRNAKAGAPIVLLGGTHTNEKEQITIGSQFNQQVEIKGYKGSSVSVHIQEVNGDSWINVESGHELSFHDLNLTLVEKRGTAEFTSHLFFASGRLKLDTVHFTSASSIVCSRSLLCLSGSEATLASVVFSGLRMGGASVVAWSGETLITSATHFSTITRSSGDGAAVELKPAQRQKLVLANLACTGCVCSSGSGGAFAGELSGGTVLIGTSDGETSFSSCVASKKGGAIYLNLGTRTKFELNSITFGMGNRATKGNNVYLSTGKPSSISLANFASIQNIKDTNCADFCFTDTSTDPPTDDLPIFILLSDPDPLWVTTAGHNYTRCGSSEYPCHSLTYIASSVKARKEKNILISDSSTYPSPSAWENLALAIKGSSSTNRPSIIVGESESYPLSAKVELENLSFPLPSSRSSALFSRIGGCMTMTACMLSLPVLLDYTVWSLTSSALLTLTSVSVSSISGTCSSTASLLSLSQFASLTVELSHFSSLTKEGNGGILSNENAVAGSSQSINISSSSFDQCSVSGGDGGALWVGLLPHSSLSLSNSSFSQCSVSSPNGKGGAVYLDITNNTVLNLSLSSVAFANNTAAVGQDLFVLCSSVERQLSFSALSLFFPSVSLCEGSGRVVAGEEREGEEPATHDLTSFILLLSSPSKDQHETEGKGEKSPGASAARWVKAGLLGCAGVLLFVGVFFLVSLKTKPQEERPPPQPDPPRIQPHPPVPDASQGARYFVG